MLYIGCPMWGNKDWIGTLFPHGTSASAFLRLYSRKLTTVEGNTVFYATPSEETITRWREETPDTFRFCPKISRSISHDSPLDKSRDALYTFVERMRGLGSRLGPMFLQLPPSFAPAHLDQLEAFLNYWPPTERLAVEVRHPDFFTAEHTASLNTLLSQHKGARIILDTRPIRVGSAKEQQELQTRERKPHLPLQLTSTTDFIFIRYIGHPRMEVNKPFLEQWAQQLGQWLQQGLTLYVFCHCPYEKYSPQICHELYEPVQKQYPPLPPLPWHVDPEEAAIHQARLFDEV